MIENMAELMATLKVHEGVKKYPYKCTAGKLTIGVGRNLEDNGLSPDEIEYLLLNDISRCHKELNKYVWYTQASTGVQHALINMCFNLGITRLLGFKKMIAALMSKDYEQAAAEALDSRWAQQVGKRAHDVTELIRGG